MKNVPNNMKNLPKGVQRIGIVASECVSYLMMKKGFSQKVAEDMVIVTLKESEEYIKSKMYDSVIASLRMIHMDVPVEKVAMDMIKSWK